MTEQAQKASATASDILTPPKLWLAYCVPMIVFIAFTALEGELPKYLPILKNHYPEFYCLKAFIVTACLIVYRKVFADIQYYAKFLLPAALFGVLAAVAWVVIDRYVPYYHFGARTGFNPFQEIGDPMLRYGFIAVRFYGLAVMVPIMEELFWRSFLLRYVTDQDDFKRIRFENFSINAFLIVAVLFGLAHPEWLVAVLFAATAALLLKKTKSVFACVVFHAVTNLSLGIYVMISHDWKYW